MASTKTRAGDHSGAKPGFRLDNRPEPLREWLRAMWGYRTVLVALSRKEFKIRYKRTALGVLWAAAMPLFQTMIMVFVFSRVGRFGTGGDISYAGFVLAGMVPFIYASTSILTSTTSIVDGSGLTDKVWFPRGMLALVSPLANLVTLAISILVLLVALPILDVSLTPKLLLLVPAILLTIAFVGAVGLLLSALQVYFRDVKFIVQAVMLVWLYLTPIVYPQSTLETAGPWLDFNPLTGIVGLYQRAAVDAPAPTGRALVVSVVATLVFGVIAISVHRRHDRLFVDLL